MEYSLHYGIPALPAMQITDQVWIHAPIAHELARACNTKFMPPVGYYTNIISTVEG